jgi:uncharacterized membrane protein YqjE
MKELFENLQGYIHTNIELAKLELQEKVDQNLQKIIKIGFLILFILLSIIFALIFLSILISSFLNSYVAGFGIISLLLLVSSGVLIYFWQQNKQ